MTSTMKSHGVKGIPVRKRLREPLAAFLEDSLPGWAEGPQPIGWRDDCYFLGWTELAAVTLKREGALLMIDVAGYSEFRASASADAHLAPTS